MNVVVVKEILRAFRKSPVMVQIMYKNSGPFDQPAAGWVQSVRGNEAVIDDCFGGAYAIPVDEVTSIHMNDGERPLIVLANWQEGGQS